MDMSNLKVCFRFMALVLRASTAKQIYNNKNTWIVRFCFGDGGLESWTCREWRPQYRTRRDSYSHLDHRPLFNEVLNSIVKSLLTWLAG